MWWASALLAAPSTSPRIVAPRAAACSHSSRISTAAPSPITKPSRSTSNGRLTPLVESAVMLPNPASAVIVPAASAAAGDHGVAAAPGDQAGGVADGVRAGGTGRAHRLARALQPPAHRDRRAGGVGHHHRHEERRHPPLALLDPDDDLVLERAQPADAGGEDRAEAGRVDAEVTGLVERLGGGGDGELLHAVGAARLLGRRRTTGWDPSPATSIERPDVMPGPEEALPERLLADAARGEHAEPGDRRPGDPSAP